MEGHTEELDWPLVPFMFFKVHRKFKYHTLLELFQLIGNNSFIMFFTLE